MNDTETPIFDQVIIETNIIPEAIFPGAKWMHFGARVDDRVDAGILWMPDGERIEIPAAS